MECLNVFLLGTPGCGKSEVYRRISKRMDQEDIAHKFERVDDFPKLWEIFQTDTDRQRSRETDDGGFKVTDPTVWDDILKELNKDILDKQENDKVLFIEFSRPNYVESIKENFSDEIKEQGMAVYIYAPFDVCWDRNVARHEQALAEGDDDHLVSRDEMEETYGSDDHDQLEDELDMPVVIVDNATNNFDKLDAEIEEVIEEIKKNFAATVSS